MADTIEILKELARYIRYATRENENTSERVGRTFVGILNLIKDLENIYLHKNQPDETNFLIKFLGGLYSVCKLFFRRIGRRLFDKGRPKDR